MTKADVINPSPVPSVHTTLIHKLSPRAVLVAFSVMFLSLFAGAVFPLSLSVFSLWDQQKHLCVCVGSSCIAAQLTWVFRVDTWIKRKSEGRSTWKGNQEDELAKQGRRKISKWNYTEEKQREKLAQVKRKREGRKVEERKRRKR